MGVYHGVVVVYIRVTAASDCESDVFTHLAHTSVVMGLSPADGNMWDVLRPLLI